MKRCVKQYVKKHGQIRRILVCRTDNIGDMVLTIPMITLLKRTWPNCQITVLGRGYIQAVVEACAEIDHFMSWDTLQQQSTKEQIAALKTQQFDVAINAHANNHALTKLIYQAKIPIRIGRGRRLSKRLYLNCRLETARLLKGQHEAELNMGLIEPLGISCSVPADDLYELMSLNVPAPTENVLQFLSKDKFNLVLHPFSNGSAREWPLDFFMQLCQKLDPKKFHIIFTGSKAEGEKLLRQQEDIQRYSHVQNSCGQLSLAELLILLTQVNGLISNSTGPLHMAAALETPVLGLFPQSKGIGLSRWRAIGSNALSIATPEVCSKQCCFNHCECMRALSVESVVNVVKSWQEKSISD